MQIVKHIPDHTVKFGGKYAVENKLPIYQWHYYETIP